MFSFSIFLFLRTPKHLPRIASFSQLPDMFHRHRRLIPAASFLCVRIRLFSGVFCLCKQILATCPVTTYIALLAVLTWIILHYVSLLPGLKNLTAHHLFFLITGFFHLYPWFFSSQSRMTHPGIFPRQNRFFILVGIIFSAVRIIHATSQSSRTYIGMP